MRYYLEAIGGIVFGGIMGGVVSCAPPTTSIVTSDTASWQEINSPSHYCKVWRQATPEGWVVMSSRPEGVSLVHVPDIAHAWSGR